MITPGTDRASLRRFGKEIDMVEVEKASGVVSSAAEGTQTEMNAEARRGRVVGLRVDVERREQHAPTPTGVEEG